jgi:hypothetical protein
MWDLYMCKNLTLSLWEFWQDFKNLTYYTENLCIRELLIRETMYLSSSSSH